MVNVLYTSIIKVVILGCVPWAGFETFLATVTNPHSFEPCDKSSECIYSLWTDSGLPKNYPVNPLTFTPVYNGQSDKDINEPWQSIAWLGEKYGCSPHCPNSTLSEDAQACKAIDVSRLQEAVNDWFLDHTSIVIYKCSLRGWVITRMLHDILLLHHVRFVWTMKLSHLSTVFLFVAAASAVFVTWNALTLMMIQNMNGQCACFFRLGLPASVIVIAVPSSLTLHFVCKVEDSLRASLGGDYLITKKFHVVHHLQVARRLNPLTSVLGTGGLGAFTTSEIPSPERALLPQKVMYQYYRACLVSWSTLLLLGIWSFPMPLFIHRAATIYWQIGPFTDYSYSKGALRWMVYWFRTFYLFACCCFGFFFLVARSPFLPRTAELTHSISLIPSLMFISDPNKWLWSDSWWRAPCVPACISVHFELDSLRDRANILKRALQRCPEVADKQSLDTLLLEHLEHSQDKEDAKEILDLAFRLANAEQPLLF